MSRDELIRLLNEDLSLAFRAHVQTISNLTNPVSEEFEAARKRRISRLCRRTELTVLLARQIEALGGLPTTEVAPIHWSTNGKAALAEELALDHVLCHRLQQRSRQAAALEESKASRTIDEIEKEITSERHVLKQALQKDRELAGSHNTNHPSRRTE